MTDALNVVLTDDDINQLLQFAARNKRKRFWIDGEMKVHTGTVPSDVGKVGAFEASANGRRRYIHPVNVVAYKV